MNVYFVRHGESVANKNKILTSQIDFPLSEKGIQDAVDVRAKLAGISFDRVYSSDLCRAVQTAHEALPQMEGEPLVDKRLREFDFGSPTGLSFVEIHEKYGELFDRCNAIPDYSPMGGESTEEMEGRIGSFMKDLEKLEGCENVAVFCHNGSVVMALRYILGAKIEKTRIKTKNCGMTVAQWNGKDWKLLAFNE